MPADPQLNTPSAETLRAFAGIVGEKYALTAAGDQERYLHELRKLYIGKTPLVLRPGSTEEVSRIMALAYETGTARCPPGRQHRPRRRPDPVSEPRSS